MLTANSMLSSILRSSPWPKYYNDMVRQDKDELQYKCWSKVHSSMAVSTSIRSILPVFDHSNIYKCQVLGYLECNVHIGGGSLSSSAKNQLKLKFKG